NILAYPIMTNAKVLAGFTNVETTIVESVSVIELPVEQFVNSNDFVLTTAIGCRDEQVFLSLVRDVYFSKAAAMVVAIGGHVTHIPKVVQHFVIENNFPLITIPWTIRFSDLIKLITSDIYRREQFFFRKLSDLQTRLVYLYLHGKPIRSALLLITENFGTNAFLVDKKHNVVIESSTQSPNIQLSPELKKNIHDFQQFDFILHDNVTLTLFIEHPKFQIVQQFFERVASVLALWFKNEQISDQAIAFKNRRIFFHRLLQIDKKNIEASELKYHKLSLDKNYLCIVAIQREQGSKRISIYEIEKLINEAASKTKIELFSCYYKQQFCLLLNPTSRAVLLKFMKNIDLLVNDHSFMWGIADIPFKLEALSEGLTCAQCAVQLCIKFKLDVHVFFYSDTSKYRVFDALATLPAMNELINAILSPLIKYKDEHGLDLVLTLKALINNMANVSKAARDLSLQRQSMLYRMHKIEALTHCKLYEPEDFFILQLCLTISTLLKK
ncbi:MAG: PucR family transcriptional regulator ligand-binding domain-containing protein, partial [Sporolactobacillus sp.]